jgi:hypothetical protein
MTNVVRFKKILLLSFLTAMPVIALAGGAGPGGGDGIRCNDGKVYSLDYRLTTGSSQNVAPELAKYSSGEDLLKMMAQQISTKIPKLGASMSDFLKFNEVPEAGQKRLWIDTDLPIIYLDDQDIDVTPKECLDAKGQPNVWQAVVRTPVKNGFVIYKRDQNALKEMAKNSPVQVSFTYVHEWLRDYTQDVTIIRNVNRYLHTMKWVGLSGESFRAVLTAFGLEKIGNMKTAHEIDAEKKADEAEKMRIAKLDQYIRETAAKVQGPLAKCQNMPGNSQNALQLKLDCLIDLELEMRGMLKLDGSDDLYLLPTLDAISNMASNIEAALSAASAH